MASRIYLGYLFGEQDKYDESCSDIREYQKQFGTFVSPIIAKGNRIEGIEARY